MDLTKLSEVELNALDLDGPEVVDWLGMLADRVVENPDRGRLWTDDEARVWHYLLRRENQRMRHKRADAAKIAAS